ncbi:hypothetical protein P7C70_g1494, partial [Phenoliferia sp. Uapishka_3]
MKFGRYLKEHSEPAWSRAYLNYRILKKAIGKAVEELEDGVQPGSSGQPAEGAEGSRPVRRRGTSGGVENIDLERGLSDGEHEDSDGEDGEHTERPRIAKPKRSETTLTPSSPHDTDNDQPRVSSPVQSDITRNSSSREELSETPTANSKHPLFRTNSSQSQAPPRNTPPRQRSLKRVDTYLTGAMDVNPRKWRKEYSPTLSLDELLKILPPACRKFFTILDRELEKVESFYGTKEEEANKRLAELKSQWRELADHKVSSLPHEEQLRTKSQPPLFQMEFKAYRTGDVAPLVTPVIARIPGASALIRRTQAQRGGELRRETQGSNTERHERKPKPSLFLHGRPEDYTSAKSKLKTATYEYYRFLGLLKSYKILNTTGFNKALKKFEKSTRIPCAKQYKEKLHMAHFESSTRLDELIRETEDAFATFFEHGDRKKALERLRQLGSKKMHHFTAWRSGLLTGLGFTLMVEGLVRSCQTSTRLQIPYWRALLQLFGAMYLPVLFAMFFYLNIVSWHYARINYVLIFELDDITMDWSLFRKGSKHFLLRPELGFKEHVWTYYAALSLDLLLRFSWVWYLAPGAPSVTVRGYSIAVMEVGRRIMWNAIRVESEHIGNVDGYRVTRDVPLPYVTPGSINSNVGPHTIDDEIEDESSTTKTRFFKFFHSLHDGIVKDFSPLTRIQLPTLTTRPRATSVGKKDYSKKRGGQDSSSPSDDEEAARSGGSDDDDGGLSDEMNHAEQMQKSATDGLATGGEGGDIDVGGAFAMGAVGGTVWHGIKGARNSPRGDKLLGSISAIKARAPVVGGNFGVWGGLFSTFDCAVKGYRQKEDPYNAIISGFLTGGTLAVRSEPESLGNV